MQTQGGEKEVEIQVTPKPVSSIDPKKVPSPISLVYLIVSFDFRSILIYLIYIN